MTIPTTLLWILGPLTALGAVHAAFYVEELILAALRTLTKGLATWK